MQLTRSRGFSHHTQRDFDQERADLNEGYNNYKQVAEANMNSVLASDEYTLEQKKSYLNATKADLAQKEQEYKEEMQRINEAEAQYHAEETADEYCGFAGQSSQQTSQNANDYCGTATQEDGGEENSSDNEQSNGI